MIRNFASALVDVVKTLTSDEKKYGESTEQELQACGKKLGDQLSALEVADRGLMTALFLSVSGELREKRVPRFGEIVVGASLYKRLRKLGFDHSGAQAAVNMWDMHSNEKVS